MQRICKGDKVVVLVGKDKGKQGAVLKILNDKVLVESVNVVRKHKKPNPMKGEAGGVVDKTMPLHISNVALLNPKTGKADKVGFKLSDSGNKVRFFRSTGEII